MISIACRPHKRLVSLCAIAGALAGAVSAGAGPRDHILASAVPALPFVLAAWTGVVKSTTP